MISLDVNWRGINPLYLLGALIVFHNRSTDNIISCMWIKNHYISAPYCQFYTQLLYVRLSTVFLQPHSPGGVLSWFIISFHSRNQLDRSLIISPTCHWALMLRENEKSSIGPKLSKRREVHELNKNPFLPLSICFRHPSACPLLHSPAFQTRGIFDLQDKGGVLK